MSESATPNTSEEPEDSSAGATGSQEKPKIRLSLRKGSGGGEAAAKPAGDTSSGDGEEINPGAFDVDPKPAANPDSKPRFGLKINKPDDGAPTAATPPEGPPTAPKPKPSVKIRGLVKTPDASEEPVSDATPPTAPSAEAPVAEGTPPQHAPSVESKQQHETGEESTEPPPPPPEQTAAKRPSIRIAPEELEEPEKPAPPGLVLAGQTPAESDDEVEDDPFAAAEPAAATAPAGEAAEGTGKSQSNAVLALKIAAGFVVVVGLVSVVLFFFVKALNLAKDSDIVVGPATLSVAEPIPEPKPKPPAPVNSKPVDDVAITMIEPDFDADQEEAEKYLIKEDTPPTAAPIAPVQLEPDPAVTAFVEMLSINGVREFSDSPKILVGSSFYPINSIIDETLDVRFVGLKKSTHEIIFQDSQGVLYYKRY